MNKNSILSLGLISALSVTSAASFADEKAQTQTQIRSMEMLQQADKYAEKEGRNINYSEMKRGEQQDKPKYRYRHNENNDMGKGDKVRTRTRNESVSGSQSGSSIGKNKSFGGRR